MKIKNIIINFYLDYLDFKVHSNWIRILTIFLIKIFTNQQRNKITLNRGRWSFFLELSNHRPSNTVCSPMHKETRNKNNKNLIEIRVTHFCYKTDFLFAKVKDPKVTVGIYPYTQWTFCASMSQKIWFIFYLFAFLENHVLFATLWEMGPLGAL